MSEKTNGRKRTQVRREREEGNKKKRQHLGKEKRSSRSRLKTAPLLPTAPTAVASSTKCSSSGIPSVVSVCEIASEQFCQLQCEHSRKAEKKAKTCVSTKYLVHSVIPVFFIRGKKSFQLCMPKSVLCSMGVISMEVTWP